MRGAAAPRPIELTSKYNSAATSVGKCLLDPRHGCKHESGSARWVVDKRSDIWGFLYQITRTGYCVINGSGVTSARPPAIAWEISIRSNGSR